jgi:hypothetical protein
VEAAVAAFFCGTSFACVGDFGTVPVAIGSADWLGWNDAIPRPPPDTAVAAGAGATVAGAAEYWAGAYWGWAYWGWAYCPPLGGGSDDVCTLPDGARG